MRDPYSCLEIDRSASAAEIKSAYRKLAKKLHPDLNPGKKDIEQKFKEVTAAYELLSDPAKRARYDRGEIDAMGNERPPFGFNGAYGRTNNNKSSRSRSYSYPFGDQEEDPFSGLGAEDVFSQFFGGGARASKPVRGKDTTYPLTIPFIEACVGGKRRFTLSNGKTIDINIPAGIQTGHKLRLKGMGEIGRGGNGDAIVEISIDKHPYYTRSGLDIHLDMPVSLPEAAMGASIKIPTLDGHVAVKVPKGANSGTILRLKGKGIQASPSSIGDMFIKIIVSLPEKQDNDYLTFIEKWSKKNAYNPREKSGWT